MDHDARLAILLLAELPRVGERRLARLQTLARERQVSLAALTALAPAQLTGELRLPQVAVQRLTLEKAWHAAHVTALAQRLEGAGIELCQPGEGLYPPGWMRRAAPPPPLATLYGNAALAWRPSIALLHSRLVSEASVQATLRIVAAAAAEGLALAVGGMKTPHRIAAATARSLGAARLIVLDRGVLAAFGSDLDRDPFGLGPTRGRFDADRTLVLSPFRPEDHAVPRSARRRDALLVALADIVIVVSARQGGEVERCALAALARGQHVLMWEDGSAALATAGAHRLDAVELANGLRRWLPTSRLG